MRRGASAVGRGSWVAVRARYRPTDRPTNRPTDRPTEVKNGGVYVPWWWGSSPCGSLLFVQLCQNVCQPPAAGRSEVKIMVKIFRAKISAIFRRSADVTFVLSSCSHAIGSGIVQHELFAVPYLATGTLTSIP